MTFRETVIGFEYQGEKLLGILHLPDDPPSCGVVIVPGAPQYRVGSHRQFVLLARDLAAAGFAVLRFDYRGMGDSDGAFRSFEEVDEDISAAIDCLYRQVPGLKRIALWGLCDGASAICFFAQHDPRVEDLVLINPWVRTEESLARAQIGNYYSARLLSRDFWRRLLTGEVKVLRAALGFLSRLRVAGSGKPASGGSGGEDAASLPERVGRALRAFEGRVLLILSGRDLTAQEFDGAVLGARDMASWRQIPAVTIRHLESANHTYSRVEWRQAVHGWTIEHLNQRHEERDERTLNRT